MPGLSKVIVLDPDARASRQVQLGFEREGIPATAVPADAARLPPPGPDTGLVVVGGVDGQGLELLGRARSWLDGHRIDAPLVFAGRGVSPEEATAAGADEAVRSPAYLRDVVTIGRLLRGLPAGHRHHLVGNLIDVTGVFTLVRALSALGRSATLTLVRGLRRGEVRFWHGEVTSAHLGMIHGQAALHQLLLWTDARFDFHHENIVRRHQIPLSPDELFADAERFLAGVRDSSGGLSPAMVLEQEVERVQLFGRQIPTEVYGVLRMFDGHHTVADVLEDSPYRVFETLRVAQRAVEVGLLRVVVNQPRRPSWRTILPIEDWLVGAAPRDAPAAPAAAAAAQRSPAPVAVPQARSAPAAQASQSKSSRKRKKKRRADTPPPVAARPAPPPEIDWGALIPRTVGADVGPLAGVIPASHVSGEIAGPAARDGEAEPVADEPSIVFDEAAELAHAAADRAAADRTAAEPGAATAPAAANRTAEPATAEPAAAEPTVATPTAKPAATEPVAADRTTKPATADDTAEPADGTTAEPADGTTAEPADGTTAEPADGTTTEPADGTTTEPADGTTTEPAAADRTTTEPAAADRTTEPAAADRTTEPAAADRTTEPAAADRTTTNPAIGRGETEHLVATHGDTARVAANAVERATTEGAARATAQHSPGAAREPVILTGPAVVDAASVVGTTPVAATPVVRATPGAEATPGVETIPVAGATSVEATPVVEATPISPASDAITAPLSVAAEAATRDADVAPATEATGPRAAGAAGDIDATGARAGGAGSADAVGARGSGAASATGATGAHDAGAVSTTEAAGARHGDAAGATEAAGARHGDAAGATEAAGARHGDAAGTADAAGAHAAGAAGEAGAAAAPDEIADEPSDGVVRHHITTAETAPVRRRFASEPPEDDRPDDATGEITMPLARPAVEIRASEPTILVADLAAAHVAVSAVADAQAARPATEDAASPRHEAVALEARDDAEAFNEIDEEFFRAGHAPDTADAADPADTGPPAESFADLDEGYRPVGFWERLRGKAARNATRPKKP